MGKSKKKKKEFSKKKLLLMLKDLLNDFDNCVNVIKKYRENNDGINQLKSNDTRKESLKITIEERERIIQISNSQRS